jgi:hypothetical protein
MKKCAFLMTVLMLGSLFALAQDDVKDGSGRATHEEILARRLEVKNQIVTTPGTRNMGLAPLLYNTFFDFDLFYSSFRVFSYTSGNSMLGVEGTYTWSYYYYNKTSRALYVFDVTSLGPGSYAFEVTAEQNSGSDKTVTIYDAEDFGLQKLGPYNSGDAAASFGSGTPLQSLNFPAGPTTLTFGNVSSSINADRGGLTGFLLDVEESQNGPSYTWTLTNAQIVTAGATVPTMSEYGLIGLVVLLLIGGILFIKKAH